MSKYEFSLVFIGLYNKWYLMCVYSKLVIGALVFSKFQFQIFDVPTQLSTSTLSSTIRRLQFIYNSKFRIVQKNDCIQYYVLPTSVLKFCGSRFLFSPRNLYFCLVLTLRNKNNIDVDNNFTLDSTLIPIVQLKVEKKDDQRWYPISEKDSKNLSNPNDSSQLESKYVFFILTDRLGGKEAWRPPHFS